MARSQSHKSQSKKSRLKKARSIKSDDILDAALAIAADVSWAKVRLRHVAERLGVSPADLRRHVPDLDAVGNLLFARADRAMLEAATVANFDRLPAKERLYLTLLAWFDVLAPHRQIVRQMLSYKLKPAHIHLHAALVVGLSRTVQWWREAAHLDAIGRRQEVEEIGLSTLFVATFLHWLYDPVPDQEGARQSLKRRLNAADRLMATLYRKPGRNSKPEDL